MSMLNIGDYFHFTPKNKIISSICIVLIITSMVCIILKKSLLFKIILFLLVILTLSLLLYEIDSAPILRYESDNTIKDIASNDEYTLIGNEDKYEYWLYNKQHHIVLYTCLTKHIAYIIANDEIIFDKASIIQSQDRYIIQYHDKTVILQKI